MLVVAATAVADMVPAPVGPAPLRYRDVIFPTVTKTLGLSYGSAPGSDGTPVNLTLDMFRPAADTQTLRPAIVLVHGGGFSGGNSKNGAMVTMANAFSQRGYVAVSINYRLLNTTHEKCGTQSQPSQNCINAAIAAQHDAQAAVRWLRRNAETYGIDPTRIAIGGGSAGAATALAVAVNSTDPGDSGNPGYSSKVGAAISISGALPGPQAKALFDPGDSPTLMFEGTADTVVPYAAASQTASEMRAAGITVVFEPLQGGGHVPMAAFGDTIVSQSVDFAYDHLDLARAAGQHTAAPSASIATPRGGGRYAVGQLVKTSFGCAEGNGGPGIASCRDSNGASPTSGQLDTRQPGVHTYRVTAISGDGYQAATSMTYRVMTPAPSHLAVSPRRFRAASSGSTLQRRGGLRISYRDRFAATTRFVIRRVALGVKSGRRCVAPRGRRLTAHAACTRLVTVGSFSHHDRVGTNTLRFSGRLNRVRLAAGAYVLQVTAALGGETSRTVTARFQVLPRPR